MMDWFEGVALSLWLVFLIPITAVGIPLSVWYVFGRNRRVRTVQHWLLIGMVACHVLLLLADVWDYAILGPYIMYGTSPELRLIGPGNAFIAASPVLRAIVCRFRHTEF